MAVELLKNQPTASSNDEDSVENSSSSEEVETDTESKTKTEPTVDSKKVETLTTVNSSSRVANPPLVDSNKVGNSRSVTDEGEEAKRISREDNHTKSVEEDASFSEEETDSESETEPAVDSNKVETSKSETDEGEEGRRVSREDDQQKSVEEDASSSEEEETDCEPETKEPEVETYSLAKPIPTEPSSPEEDESDSEPETEPVAESPVTNPVVKHSTGKVEASSKKRSSETDKRRAKKVKRNDDVEETKKNYFQKIWTDEDEILVLQGLIDYEHEKGSSPFYDKKSLYERLEDSFSFKVTKTQFYEKIRSLKKKYDRNLGKEKKKGEALVFPKSQSHEREAFRLSKFVWGDNEIVAAKRLEPTTPESVSGVDSVTCFGIHDAIAKKGWSRLSSEDKKRFEEELQLEEFKYNSRKSLIVHNIFTKIVESYQPGH